MRLGDLDALKKTFDNYAKANPNLTGVFELGKFIIDNTPTIEGEILTKEAYSDLCLRASQARPQGEWKLGSIGVYCSECGTHPDYSTNFCPNCGAEMRKGGAEE